MTVTRCVQREH